MFKWRVGQLFTTREWVSTFPLDGPQSGHDKQDASSLLHNSAEISKGSEIREEWHNETKTSED